MLCNIKFSCIVALFVAKRDASRTCIPKLCHFLGSDFSFRKMGYCTNYYY